MSTDANKMSAFKGRGALLLATIIWGSSFVVLKNTLNDIPVFYVLAFRFSGAAILLLLLCMKELKKLDKGHLKSGLIMGVCLFVAYTFQTYGLYYTTPGKNAFLTTTYCIIVPFLFWLTAKKRPDKFNIFAAVICIVGVGFVSLENNFVLNLGDILTIICGLFYALHILAINKYVEGRSIALLIIIQFATAAALSWIFAPFAAPFPTQFSAANIWSIVYLCVLCTAACYFLQAYGQRYTPPSSAAIIITLESVFGALISVIFYGEVLNLQLVAGFVLIFAAVLISETKLTFLRRPKESVGTG